MIGQVDVGALGYEAAGARTSGGGASAAAAAGFGGALDAAMRRSGGAETESEVYRKTREAAEELVSGALVRPVLAQLRDTNQAPPPFAPGLWEKTFGPLLDAEISKKIVKSSKLPLVESLTKQFVSRHSAQAGGTKEAGDA